MSPQEHPRERQSLTRVLWEPHESAPCQGPQSSLVLGSGGRRGCDPPSLGPCAPGHTPHPQRKAPGVHSSPSPPQKWGPGLHAPPAEHPGSSRGERQVGCPGCTPASPGPMQGRGPGLRSTLSSPVSPTPGPGRALGCRLSAGQAWPLTHPKPSDTPHEPHPRLQGPVDSRTAVQFLGLGGGHCTGHGHPARRRGQGRTL